MMSFITAGPAIIRSRMTWVTVLGITIYVGLGRGFEITPLSEVLRVAQISLASVVIAAYWRNAASCYTVVGRWPDRDELIALGIVVSWTSVLANGLWGLFWRLSGQPPWMVNNDWFNAWVALNCSAAFLHIKAPNVFGRHVPKVDRAVLAGVFAGMVVAATIITVARPDLRPYAEALRPLMEEPHEDLDLKGLDGIRGICHDLANGNLPP